MRFESVRGLHTSSTLAGVEFMRKWDDGRASRPTRNFSESSDTVPFRVIRSSSVQKGGISSGFLHEAILKAHRDIDALVAQAKDDTDLRDLLLERIRENQQEVEDWLGLSRQLEIAL